MGGCLPCLRELGAEEESGGAVLGLHVLGYAAMAVRWAAVGAGRAISAGASACGMGVGGAKEPEAREAGEV